MDFSTHYSLLDGAISPADACAATAAWGQTCLAVADAGNIYGLPDFVERAGEAGLKPIAAAVISERRSPPRRTRAAAFSASFSATGGYSPVVSSPTVAPYGRSGLSRPGASGSQPDDRFAGEAGGPVDAGGQGGQPLFTLYCKDQRGFERLCSLLTGLRFATEPRDGAAPPWMAAFASPSLGDPVEELAQRGWDGLFVVSSRPEVLARLAGAGRAGTGRDGESRGGGAVSRGGARRKGELEDLLVPVVPGAASRAYRDLAGSLGLGLVAVQPVRLLGEGDLLRYRFLQAAARRVPWSVVAGEFPRGFDASGTVGALPLWVGKNGLDPWSSLPGSLETARRLMDSCENATAFLSAKPIFPPYQGLDDEGATGLLRRLCEAAISSRYGKAGPAVAERLSRELAIIGAKGFSSYFLAVRDIVGLCPRTCGRGSAAASIVSYLLGITQVDPLAHGLFFERFLNEGRTDPPDIDIDFPWDEREALIRRVLADNAGRAALVADHCTFARRGALREAAIALGYGDADLARFSLLDRLDRTGELPADLLAGADALQGTPRYIGTHPGGVVITPRPLAAYTQVQLSPTGLPVIAWEKDGAERAGLVKIDLLGNRALAVLRDTIDLANGRTENREAPLSWNALARKTLPGARDEAAVLGDRSARELLARGQSLGIFYVESPATRRLLRRMRRADYEHLVVASSIIRPAANHWIDEYLRRLRGGSWKPIHPDVESTLAETLGIMVYQEDVSRVAMAAAGFDATEADRLRKTLSKKNRAKKLEEFRTRFVPAAREHGLSPEAVDTLWDMILSFNGYSFCKSHSASYALVSYRLAWLRARYPLEFFTAVINNGGGFYGRQVYVDEVRILGFPILPPEVNASGGPYTCVDGALRVGLYQLAELSRGFVGLLLAEKDRRGPFLSAEDFFRRTEPDFGQARTLIRSGVLDALPCEASGTVPGRPGLFWLHHRMKKGESGARDLFAAAAPPACLEDYPASVRLRDEARYLGLIVSRHPAAIFRPRAERLLARRPAGRERLDELIDSRLLPARSGRRVAIMGVLVAAKEVLARRPGSPSGSGVDPMAFYSLGDERGLFEVVFFPKAWARFRPILEVGTAFLLEGFVLEEDGVFSVNPDEVACLDRARIAL